MDLVVRGGGWRGSVHHSHKDAGALSQSVSIVPEIPQASGRVASARGQRRTFNLRESRTTNNVAWLFASRRLKVSRTSECSADSMEEYSRGAWEAAS
ncbi:hypothetical protein J6590_001920 [Homalodisca vitripennis]|nr:hypothetical protein J6590_001920 [Homalodisca vitripennis]